MLNGADTTFHRRIKGRKDVVTDRQTKVITALLVADEIPTGSIRREPTWHLPIKLANMLISKLN